MVVQTQHAVVCYPRLQLLPEIEEIILCFVEQIFLEALSMIPSDHDTRVIPKSTSDRLLKINALS